MSLSKLADQVTSCFSVVRMLPPNTITLSIAGCLTFGMEVTQFKTYVRRSECHAFMYMYIPCILHKMLWPVVSRLQVVTGTNSNLQLH